MDKRKAVVIELTSEQWELVDDAVTYQMGRALVDKGVAHLEKLRAVSDLLSDAYEAYEEAQQA